MRKNRREELAAEAASAIADLIRVKIDEALGKRAYYAHTLDEEARVAQSIVDCIEYCEEMNEK